MINAFARDAMGRRIDLSWSGHIELFLVSASAHYWCMKGGGMCHHVCMMVHIKEHLLLIGRGFVSRYLSGPLPYV